MQSHQYKNAAYDPDNFL